MSINLQVPSLTILAAKESAKLGLSPRTLEKRLNVQALGYVQAQSQGLNLQSLTKLLEEKPFLYRVYINLIETSSIELKEKTISVFTRLNITNYLYYNTVDYTLSGSEMAKIIVRVCQYLESLNSTMDWSVVPDGFNLMRKLTPPKYSFFTFQKILNSTQRLSILERHHLIHGLREFNPQFQVNEDTTLDVLYSEFENTLPEAETAALKKILDLSFRQGYHKIVGIISKSPRFEDLEPASFLVEYLIQSIERGRILLFLALAKSEYFTKIPLHGSSSLTEILLCIARQSVPTVVISKIKQHPLFQEISSDHIASMLETAVQSQKAYFIRELLLGHPNFGNMPIIGGGATFGRVLIYKATQLYRNGNKVISMLLETPLFDKLPANGRYSLLVLLGKTINMTSEYVDIEIIKKITNHRNFKKIRMINNPSDKKTYCLAFVLYYAIFHEQAQTIIKELAKHPRFQEINPNGKNSLAQALNLAVALGRHEAITELCKHPRFQEIDPNGKCSLGYFLNLAIKEGNISKILKLLQHPLFPDIQLKGAYSLSELLYLAADQALGATIIERLAEHPHFMTALYHVLDKAVTDKETIILIELARYDCFKNINPNGEYSLARLLCSAIQKENNFEAISVFIKHPRFQEINPNGEYPGECSLDQALNLAVSQGRHEVITELCKHPRFQDIIPDGTFSLGYFLNLAIKEGDRSKISELLANPVFLEMNPNGECSLAKFLCLAIQEENHSDVILAFLKHICSQEINPNGEYSLDQALNLAVSQGRHEVITELCKHFHFRHIIPSGKFSLSYLLHLAIRGGHRPEILKLLANPLFQEINPNGEYSLARALYEAAVNGNLDIIQRLIKHRQFKAVNLNGQFSINHIIFAAAIRKHTDVENLIRREYI